MCVRIDKIGVIPSRCKPHAVQGAWSLHRKAPFGRHHIQRLACLQTCAAQLENTPPCHGSRTPRVIVPCACSTSGVLQMGSCACTLALQLSAHGDELPGFKSKGVAQLRGMAR